MKVVIFCLLMHFCNDFVTSRESLVRYSIPGANVLNWSYYPSARPPNHNVLPNFDSDKQLLPAKTSTTKTTPRITTTATTQSTEVKPMHGSKPIVSTPDEVEIDEFLDWVAQNPDPNKKISNEVIDEFPVLEYPDPNNEPKEFAFINLPENEVKCPRGLRNVYGVCRRGFIQRQRPRP